jgi:Zn-finger nucleic acid-binding protein
MLCPVCDQAPLLDQHLEPQLRVKTCGRCSGHWIDIDTFARWRELAPVVDEASGDLQVLADSQSALLCPVSGRLMQKYRFSAGNTHRLDYSAAVGAVWLDGGEWQLLKRTGMALQLSQILTEHWQRQLRSAHAAAKLKELYAQKFGVDAYQKVSAMRVWLAEQPHKDDLLAYLSAVDPYSAQI